MTRPQARRRRRRGDLQLRRKAIRRGVCPCEDPRIEDPGPDHLPACPWSDPEYGVEIPF